MTSNEKKIYKRVINYAYELEAENTKLRGVLGSVLAKIATSRTIDRNTALTYIPRFKEVEVNEMSKTLHKFFRLSSDAIDDEMTEEKVKATFPPTGTPDSHNDIITPGAINPLLAEAHEKWKAANLANNYGTDALPHSVKMPTEPDNGIDYKQRDKWLTEVPRIKGNKFVCHGFLTQHLYAVEISDHTIKNYGDIVSVSFKDGRMTFQHNGELKTEVDTGDREMSFTNLCKVPELSIGDARWFLSEDEADVRPRDGSLITYYRNYATGKIDLTNPVTSIYSMLKAKGLKPSRSWIVKRAQWQIEKQQNSK